MMQRCKACQHPLTMDESGFICQQCGARYERQARCPQCQQPLENLSACGAVNYFCAAHGLVSKKQVLFLPV